MLCVVRNVQCKTSESLNRNSLHFIKNALHLSVNAFSMKEQIEEIIFASPIGDGTANAVIPATRRSSRLLGKGSIFISQLFYDP